ncbi:MAG TPA: hypothetical protein VGD45_21080 [Steroidobacter sp.]|uniref:hypothetical protein n=1 Tax=Steroidobacter sp. TaxID=1978227 RepID=UPI002EDB9D86
MREQIQIPQDICAEALQVAVYDGLPEVIRILNFFQDGAAGLNSRETAHFGFCAPSATTSSIALSQLG